MVTTYHQHRIAKYNLEVGESPKKLGHDIDNVLDRGVLQRPFKPDTGTETDKR